MTTAQGQGGTRRTARSHLGLGSTTSKIWDRIITKKLCKKFSFGVIELERPLPGAIQFSSMISTETEEARLSASKASCAVSYRQKRKVIVI